MQLLKDLNQSGITKEIHDSTTFKAANQDAKATNWWPKKEQSFWKREWSYRSLPNNWTEGEPWTVYLPFETCGKTNYPTEKFQPGANAAVYCFTRRKYRQERTRSNQTTTKILELGVSRLQLNLQTKEATSSFRNCYEETGDHQNNKSSTNPRGLWESPPDTAVESLNYLVIKMSLVLKIS